MLVALRRRLHAHVSLAADRRGGRVRAVAQHERAVNLAQVLRAAELHDGLELVLDDLHSARNAELAADGHAVNHGAPQHHRLRAESEGLKNVAAALDAAVDVHLDGEEAATLNQVGETLGLSRERIRQLEAEALALLSPVGLGLGRSFSG